ncbi:MAG: metalloprotease PmbA [Burkholderiales bacterium]|nr:MAG: metalloprotease PmbA [Betaproteobacteria bacterium]TAG24926.1 MAG: metalloprotease PmbA [Burkholderiales bacterium]
MPLALSSSDLRDISLAAIEHAKRGGADQAEAEVTQGSGLNVTVRMGELETLEHNVDKSLGVTVYVGGRKGNASSGDFSAEAMRVTVDKALAIAKYTSPDEFSGLADAELMARDMPDLDLYHPWEIDVEAATALAKLCEDAGFAVDERIDNSEGASVSVSESEFYYANSHGFVGGYKGSAHYIGCSMVASDGDEMERDDWYTSHRVPGSLESAESVGRKAGERAVARLKPRKLPTQTSPVIFTPQLAGGFLGHGISALYGGSLYRKTSFLLDSMGKDIFAPLVNIVDDPHIKRAYASSPFDGEGVACQKRTIVENGVIRGYFLSAYSARKLGMASTGNAGGNHNLVVKPTVVADTTALAQQMRRGLIVTELMGQGVNPVTGDYSRGAAGFWVENGEIQYPVSEITIAGNLLSLYKQILAIGNDIDERGSKWVGSVLVDSVQIAGS